MKILFISVHPDDETLGCGGTILKHSKNGDEIYWLILTDVSKELGYTNEFIINRQTQIDEVSKAYNFKKVYKLGYPTTKLHSIEFNELISKISSVINEVKPSIVYTVNRSDIHTDHQVAAKAIMSCTKSFRYPFIKKILMYECISETEIAYPLQENIFIPNAYCDISDFIEEKINIMKIYESEIQESPLPRSIENIKALARFRGSTVGVHYAEAFMLIRDVF
ncbi:PIG-L family deacetylase [Crassaminicella thermophila]|uniref:PIG-L family deacetylase n=1 Tax=Crassaminicella thermophila TaxID=2599308 RepID=A0A5C0SBM4_CRATE|nr:PIG-L family deacetylase [Crassaminicella thermophila]QEK11317.1 PIG-L family deacetylase [Crassaminicella thermophila]